MRYFALRAVVGILPALCISYSAHVAAAAEYFVAPIPSGKPTNVGSLDAPVDLRTALAGIGGRVHPGDTIWVRGGRYAGPAYTSSISGTAQSPIIVRAYQNERVVVDDSFTTTLTTNLPSTGGPCTFADSSGLQDGSAVHIDAELVYIFNRLSDYTHNLADQNTFSCISGYGGTQKADHVAGTAVFPGGSIIEHQGSYVWFWGFEITSVRAERLTNPTYKGPGLNLSSSGKGNKAINLMIYNVGHPAIGFWDQDDGGEVYGSILWGNGLYDNVTNGTPTGWRRGNGIYSQNKTGSVLISDVIAFHNFTIGIKCHAEGAYCNGFTFEGNVSFNNPEGGVGVTTSINPVDRVVFKDNQLFNNDLHAGYEAKNNQELVAIGNTISFSPLDVSDGGVMGIKEYQKPTVRNNVLYNTGKNNIVLNLLMPTGFLYANADWDYNKYYGAELFGQNDPRVPYKAGWLTSAYGLPGWINFSTASNWEKHSTDDKIGVPADQVVVRPNKYERGRAHIVVWNWQKRPSVSVSLSSTGLTNGEAFEIRDAQNLLAPPLTKGSFSLANPTVLLPLTLQGVSPILGNVTHFTNLHSPTEFNVFVVVPVTGPTQPPNPPSLEAPPAPPTSLRVEL